MSAGFLRCWLLCAVSVCLWPSLSAAAPALSYLAEHPQITLDGHLDESAWQQASALPALQVVVPDTRAEPQYSTQVLLFYTEQGLYLGAQLTQPPQSLVAQRSSRDQRDLNRDSFTLMLDTSGAGRYGYYFAVSLGDSLSDGTLLPENQLNPDWDGPWQGASARTDNGWSVEMFLPWSMFSMPALTDTRTLGIYVERRVAHLDQIWAWPSLPATQPRFISGFAQVQLQGINPRQQYSLFPYVSLTQDRLNDSSKRKAGVDLFWRPGSNLQLMGTLNPDFGNVEADAVEINLSAFETLFAEKRLFFLEGQEIFVTSARDGFRPLNTRRIGGRARAPTLPVGAEISREELNQAAELLGAAKITGQASQLRYGLLMAKEDEVRFLASLDAMPLHLTQQGSDYGAARLLYEDIRGGAYLSLGWLSTASLHPEVDAWVHALDGRYLSADARYRLDGQWLRSDISSGGQGQGGYLDLRISPRQGMQHSLALEYFDRNIDLNHLGYLRRNDYLRGDYGWRRSTTHSGWLRNAEQNTRLMAQVNHARELTSSAIWHDWTLTSNQLSRLQAGVSYYPARYDDRSSRGAGSYRIVGRWNAAAGYASDGARLLSSEWNLDYNQLDLGGDSYTAKTLLRLRPQPAFSVELEVPYIRRRGWLLHQQGNQMATFAAEEWRPRLATDLFLSARQQVRLSVQWVAVQAKEQRAYQVPASPGNLIQLPASAEPRDFNISRMQLQLRYRWELAPLSDLHLVYSRGADQRSSDSESFSGLWRNAWEEPVSDQLTLKLRYRLGS